MSTFQTNLQRLAVVSFLFASSAVIAAPAADSVDAKATKTTVSVQKTLNINTADEAAFEALKGIGDSKAKAIIAYRKANGNFKSVDDLTNVQGISDKLLAKIRDELTVG